jgi:hypothetical protein
MGKKEDGFLRVRLCVVYACARTYLKRRLINPNTYLPAMHKILKSYTELLIARISEVGFTI